MEFLAGSLLHKFCRVNRKPPVHSVPGLGYHWHIKLIPTTINSPNILPLRCPSVIRLHNFAGHHETESSACPPVSYPGRNRLRQNQTPPANTSSNPHCVLQHHAKTHAIQRLNSPIPPFHCSASPGSGFSSGKLLILTIIFSKVMFTF